MSVTSRKFEIWALVLAAVPPATFFAISLMPWAGQRHLPDDIVLPVRGALFAAVLVAIVSLYFAIRVLRARGFKPLAVIAVLLAGGFLTWAIPYAYDVACQLVVGPGRAASC